MASMQGHVKVAKALLEKGAAIDLNDNVSLLYVHVHKFKRSGDSMHTIVLSQFIRVSCIQYKSICLHFSITRFPLTWQERKVTMKLSNCWRKETIPVSYSVTVVRFNMLQYLVYIYMYCTVTCRTCSSIVPEPLPAVIIILMNERILFFLQLQLQLMNQILAVNIKKQMNYSNLVY